MNSEKLVELQRRFSNDIQVTELAKVASETLFNIIFVDLDKVYPGLTLDDKRILVTLIKEEFLREFNLTLTEMVKSELPEGEIIDSDEDINETID